MKGKVLSFPFINFSESRLFNRLQPIQVKNFLLPFLATRFAQGVAGIRSRPPPSPSPTRKRDCDPAIQNEYHIFRLMGSFCSEPFFFSLIDWRSLRSCSLYVLFVTATHGCPSAPGFPNRLLACKTTRRKKGRGFNQARS
jgi:hypothetical protein